MIFVSSSEKTRTNRIRVRPHGMLPETLGSWVTGYIGKNGSGGLEERMDRPPEELFPVAYLVEQDPGSHLRPHFHITDQFQVVIGGSGSVATHPVESVSVHFTGPFSPYGPINAGAEGIHYLTLRNGFDPGGRYMPESRLEMRAKPRKFREQIAGPAHDIGAAELARLTEISCTDLITLEPDGLASWLYRLPPGARMQGPDPRSGRGQFWVVVNGTLAHPEEGTLQRLSCIFLSSEEPAFTAVAGAQGLEILALQFPDATLH